MDHIKQAPTEIKVNTKKFSLHRGKMTLVFSLAKSKGKITNLTLVQRNAIIQGNIPFILTQKDKGDVICYHAVLDLSKETLEVAFWDVVATMQGMCPAENGEEKTSDEMTKTDSDASKAVQESYDAILGGLSAKLKLWLIAFPRWTRTSDGHLIYPFVNGARQFTIQYRKYDKRYDSYFFLCKEFLALFCYFILKPYWDRKRIWLICEKYCTMAQDNGLYFFRYCMKELPESEKNRIMYVIDKQASDYEAVKEYDEHVIQFMSFRYMIYLCAAEYLISTDAIRHFYIWDSPNSIYKVLYQARKNIIFLQHGVLGLKQCHRTFHKSGGNRMARFVVSSEYERDIVEKYFEYDREDIMITGLARWDVLENTANDEDKQILLMPTWRIWLEYASDELFRQSEYCQNYKSLLTDKKLLRLLEEEQITVYFYIHPKFREYIEEFHVDSPYIKLIPFGTRPLNELLMSCHMLITDYSSVAWDVYHQGKPIVFYPFDLQTYERAQGTYMDMEKEAFGDVVHSHDELIQTVYDYVKNGFAEKQEYADRREYLLPYRDHDNSRRIYDQIVRADLPSKLKAKLKQGI